MNNRLRVLLLVAAVTVLAGGPTLAQQRSGDSGPSPAAAPPVVAPEVTRRTIRTPAIEASDFEVGAYVGTFSAEDFGVNPVTGVRVTYHINEDFFADAIAGRTETSLSSYERLSGADLLTERERKLTYYSLGFGYNLFPGEVFIGRGRALNSAFYVTAGVGAVKFAGDRAFAVAIGAGYRLLLNDWLSAHLGVRDQMYEVDLLGSNKNTHNLETALGVSVYF